MAVYFLYHIEPWSGIPIDCERLKRDENITLYSLPTLFFTSLTVSTLDAAVHKGKFWGFVVKWNTHSIDLSITILA